MLDQVKIGHNHYTLKEVPVVNVTGSLKGEIDYIDRTIKIAEFITDDDKRETLIHEIVHGIDEFMGIDLNEEQVVKIGKGLAMVMTDNPKLFRHPSVTSEIQEAVNRASVNIIDDIQVSDKTDIDRIVDRITEIMGNQIDRHSPSFKNKVVILPSEEPVITTLSDFTTKALTEELMSREGVEYDTVENGYSTRISGPAIVIINRD